MVVVILSSCVTTGSGLMRKARPVITWDEKNIKEIVFIYKYTKGEQRG